MNPRRIVDDRFIIWEPEPVEPSNEKYIEITPFIAKPLFPELDQAMEAATRAMLQQVSDTIESNLRRGVNALEGREVSEEEFFAHASRLTQPDGWDEYRWYETVLVRHRTNAFPPAFEIQPICNP